MRLLKLQLVVFCLLFLGSNILFSQTIVKVKGPGQLYKKIKDIPTVEKLQIEGPLNNRDWKSLSTCTNLSQLDLSNVIFERGDESAFDKMQPYTLVETLIVCRIKDIPYLEKKHIIANVIFAKEDNRKILRRWNDNLDISILEQVDSLVQGAFWKSKLETIKIPANIKSIPVLCFYECENLKEVDLGEVTDISRHAFAKTNIERLKIPATVMDIEDYAFTLSNIKQLEFMGQYPPSIYHVDNYQYFKKRNYDINIYYGGEDVDFWRQCRFIIPKGSHQTFAIGEWAKFSLKEKGEKCSHTITVEKAGTLAALLPDSSCGSTDSLTIKGFLYDTDFETIKKCKHLRFLDLSHCFVTISPETLKNSGQKEIGKQLETMTLKTLEEELKKEKIDSNPLCLLHSNALERLFDLKEVRLPLQLFHLSSCLAHKKYLEKVILPPALKRIGDYAFSGCKRLKEIDIPSSIEYLGQCAFRECSSISKIDLSNTTIETIYDETFHKCENLKELRLPETIKAISKTALGRRSHDDPKFFKLYMKSKQTPQYFDIGMEVEELHIPKGCRAGYSSSYARKIIDDL